jgi:hypothetical protein
MIKKKKKKKKASETQELTYREWASGPNKQNQNGLIF